MQVNQGGLAQPAITTPATLPSGFVGGAYSQTLAATPGALPYVWSILSGALPPGLALSSAGVIAGTPTALGTYIFTVQVADSTSSTARRVEFTCTGSNLESLWLLYLFNKTYYPQSYRQRLRLKPPAMLKLNIGNRFPRLYPTRRMSRDGSVYYGPFPSRVAAERFASEFLDFFKIRRCVEDLNPDPAHPGCIYSQMKMCLAPCFQGCTDDEYQNEVRRVVAFLDDAGRPLVRELESERARASDSLDFESAAKIHSKIEKVGEVMRAKTALARNLRDLDAVLVLEGAEPKSVTFFRVASGELRGPANLSLDENVSAPVSLDEQIRALLEPLGDPARAGRFRSPQSARQFAPSALGTSEPARALVLLEFSNRAKS